jgi:hypothetical protein
MLFKSSLLLAYYNVSCKTHFAYQISNSAFKSVKYYASQISSSEPKSIKSYATKFEKCQKLNKTFMIHKRCKLCLRNNKMHLGNGYGTQNKQTVT